MHRRAEIKWCVSVGECSSRLIQFLWDKTMNSSSEWTDLFVTKTNFLARRLTSTESQILSPSARPVSQPALILLFWPTDGVVVQSKK